MSGRWIGRFIYPASRPPVDFTAVLQDAGGWLTGATEEAGQRGEAAGQLLTATLQGRRDGRTVMFLKTYDATPPGYDSVQYVGELSPDGTEIDGRWTVPGGWSGDFVMVRAGHPYAAAVRAEADKVDAR